MLGRRTSPAPVVCDQAAFWHLFKDVYPRGKYVKGNIMLVLFYIVFCLNHKHGSEAGRWDEERAHGVSITPERSPRSDFSACRTFNTSRSPRPLRADRRALIQLSLTERLPSFYYFKWACDLYLLSVHESSRSSACSSLFSPICVDKLKLKPGASNRRLGCQREPLQRGVLRTEMQQRKQRPTFKKKGRCPVS